MATSRVRIQGDLNEVASSLVTAYAKCTGKTNTGAAIELIERFVTTPEFMTLLETSIRWCPEKNKDAATAELTKLGVTPPEIISTSKN